MRFLLTPIGSSGDVFPFIGLGRRLRERGHEVILLAGEPFRAVSEAGGLTFVPRIGDLNAKSSLFGGSASAPARAALLQGSW